MLPDIGSSVWFVCQQTPVHPSLSFPQKQGQCQNRRGGGEGPQDLFAMENWGGSHGLSPFCQQTLKDACLR